MVTGKTEIFVKKANGNSLALFASERMQAFIINMQYKEGSLFISGSLQNAAGICINGKPAYLNENNWLLNIPCEYGKNNIVITTYDLEGNAVNTSLHVDVCNLDAMHANTNAIAKVGMFEDKNKLV